MIDLSTALDRLAATAHSSGGWGFTGSPTGQSPHPEPTCFALLALNLQPERFAAQIKAGLKSLATHRTPEGAYRLEIGRPQAFWPTAIALFTREQLGDPDLRPTIDCLLDVQGRSIPNDPEFAGMMDIDTALIGWPWALNTFSWVEPTATAVLALRACGQGTHPRVVEGIRTLFDRAFDTGGANYGNRTVLGQITTPFPTPTAHLLLALQGFDDEPRVKAAAAFLRSSVEKSNDLEHLAWAKIALSCYDVDTGLIEQRLSQAYQTQVADGRPIGVLRHALTLVALGTATKNYFRLSGAERNAPPLTGPHPVPKTNVVPGAKPGLFDKLKSKFKGVVITGLGAMRPLPATSAVHIASAPDYDADLFAVVKTQFEHFRAHVPLAGKKVVLKPNLVEFHPDRPINTDPRVIDAVIRLCKAEGAASITVAEGPGHWRNVEYLLDISGVGAVLRKHDVPFVDINHDEPVKTPNLGRLTGLEYLFLTRAVTNGEVLISMPKLKMHHWAGVTLSLKNLFGILPGQCYGWPKNELHWRGIPQSVVDIALTALAEMSHLAIVDGIWGMEGDGPIYGKGRHMGALVMGHDLAAVDATCARMIGMPPERVPVLVLAAMKKLGRIAEKEIPQVGEPLEKHIAKWEWAPQVEKQLMPFPEKTKAG